MTSEWPEKWTITASLPSGPGRGPRSCTGRYRCSSRRLIKRRHSARPLISGRRLAAGRSRDIHGGTFSEWTTGGRAREGGCRSVGRSGAKRDKQAAAAAAAAVVAVDRALARAGVWAWDQWGKGSNTAHSLSCFCWRAATPCPFRATKGGYHGIN